MEILPTETFATTARATPSADSEMEAEYRFRGPTRGPRQASRSSPWARPTGFRSPRPTAHPGGFRSPTGTPRPSGFGFSPPATVPHAGPGHPGRPPGPRPRHPRLYPWPVWPPVVAAPDAAAPPTSPPAPTEGTEYTRWVQSALNQVLGLSLPVDGVMSDQSRDAVRRFQRDRGLPEDGIVGPDTERALAEARRGPAAPSDSAPSPAEEIGLAPAPTASPVPQPTLRDNIVRVAKGELQRWGNGSLREKDPRAGPILRDYWARGTDNSFAESQFADSAFQNTHPWSAAFISWVMQQAGAGSLFKRSPAHSVYISWAKENRRNNNANPFKAYRITELAPRVGDLVCQGRSGSSPTYDNIAPGMNTHCDIVTAVQPGNLSVVGGNVSDSVKQRSVRTDARGFIASPAYFAVIRLETDRPVAPPAPTPLPSSPAAPTPVTPGAPRLMRRETTASGTTLYVDIDLGIVDRLGQTAAPMTGIFVPAGYRPGPAADVILYLHGFKPAADRRLAVDRFWNAQRLPHRSFREGVYQSQRNAILVVPNLGAYSEAGRLVHAGGLDAYLDRVLAAVRAYGPAGATASLGNLILACHSGGGKPMRALAGGHDRAARHVRECWGFDCTYNQGDDGFWANWGRAHPRARVYIYYIANSPTAPRSLSLRAMRIPNVVVQASKDARHEHVPIAYWRERLQRSPFLTPRPGTAAQRPVAPAPNPTTGAIHLANAELI